MSPAESHLPQVQLLHPLLGTAIREKILFSPQAVPAFWAAASSLHAPTRERMACGVVAISGEPGTNKFPS